MTKPHVGLTYVVEQIRDGVVIDREVVDNIVPTEGLNYLLSCGLDGGSQITSWYMGVFENNYTPQYTDTAALFPGGGYAGESTAYDEAARQTVSFGTVSSGVLATDANCAFTMNATKTIYGAFIASASAKSSTAGTLVSAVKFSSSKSVQDNDVLSLSASVTLSGA